ncbi:hydroxyacylglutathione hydrolase [Pseudoruegeria aquimaris]|uniref:Hydroxyacylglutathione hydrolase n=1 Tax=Pseudoruegeria aquimaris TaxID=393663 RepID=A0A1Y5R904_9RHOB|nr:MBL fold metallo-hydrolase [Pseudoruegeria aquimaris]SLN11890.1 hydroxyacylglutathione hydrolase [Pseudoruegeria aquimaris]
MQAAPQAPEDAALFAPIPGEAEVLRPGLRRVLAPNPSPMTFRGTNTYLLGEDDLAVIDPGPDTPAHLEALLAAIGDAPVTAILVTHSHRDHSPLARPLSEATGAPVLAFGDSAAGRSPMMAALAGSGALAGGEGVDADFRPDRCLADGEMLSGRGWTLEALHTPGHMGNHLCFSDGAAIFCGDLVMGWASTMVSPPDGDLAAFRASCARLRARPERFYLPAHGAPLHEPHARLSWLLAHRDSRERQILDSLRQAPGTAGQLARRIYTETPEALLPAAARNVLAHLLDLTARGHAKATPELTEQAEFSLVSDV